MSKVKLFSFLPALLLMLVIFSFSAQEGEISGQLSHRVSVRIVETADTLFHTDLSAYQIEVYADRIEPVTRKAAHAGEYFLLALAVAFALHVCGMQGFFLMICAGLFCVLFACGDEYHQSFVFGRSPSARDVGIDSIGVFFGIVLVRIIGWGRRKKVARPRRKRKEKQPAGAVPRQGNYSQDPQGNYSPPPQGNDNPPPQWTYSQTPQGTYSRTPPRRDSVFDPYWQPENEIDFDLKPEYPERDEWEKDDSFDHDWGFDDPPSTPPPPSPSSQHSGNAAARTEKKKKKQEKDWFFDL